LELRPTSEASHFAGNCVKCCLGMHRFKIHEHVMNVVMVTLMSMAMVITMVTTVSMVMVHYHGHETTLPRISCSCTKPKLDLLVLDNVFDEAGINGCCVSAASRLSKSR